MLSVIRHSPPTPYRVSFRGNVANLNRKYHAKVSALPFALSKDDAIKRVASLISVDKGRVGSLMAKNFPDFGAKPLQPNDLKAMYIPVWFIDGEASAMVTCLGEELSATIHSSNSYMPGFSFDPLSALSFSQPGLEDLAVPFTPELRHQHGIDVSCLPFSISPIPLPEVVRSLTPSQTKLPGSWFDPKSVEFSMLAAYPVLLPIYLMRYDLQIPAVPESISFACMVQAHSEDALIYIANGEAENDDLPHWEAHGPSSRFSKFSSPILHPLAMVFSGGASDWVDANIKSESNMAALAEYGVSMDHPCVRVFIKEEVCANRKFLEVAGTGLALLDFFENAPRMMESNEASQVDGEDSVGTNLMIFRKNVEETEAVKRAALKPQWLQDFQDSQRRGQFTPP